MPAKRTRTQPGHADPVQWTIASISVALVLAVFAYLGWQALFRPDIPPRITVETGEIDQHRVTFSAHNAGTRAAASVQIEGELLAGDSVIERATATLDYLPANATRGGGLIFRTAIAGGKVRVRATGYADP
jgi:uncharacterized protein (TIGR02588 family)